MRTHFFRHCVDQRKPVHRSQLAKADLPDGQRYRADTTSPTGTMIMTEYGDITEFGRSLILTGLQERRAATQVRSVAFGHLRNPRCIRIELAMDFISAGRSAVDLLRCPHVQCPPRSNLLVLKRTSVPVSDHRPARA